MQQREVAGYNASAIKKQRVTIPFLILLPLSPGCWDDRLCIYLLVVVSIAAYICAQ